METKNMNSVELLDESGILGIVKLLLSLLLDFECNIVLKEGLTDVTILIVRVDLSALLV